MFESQKIQATLEVKSHFRAQIKISNGSVVGVGLASKSESAKFRACLDAVQKGNCEAACGHAVFLGAKKEATIRKIAAKRGYR